MKTHLPKVDDIAGKLLTFRRWGKGRMEGKRGYRRTGWHGMRTHLRKVGRYSGKTAHLRKVAAGLLGFDVFDAADVAFFLVNVRHILKQKIAIFETP